MLIKVNNADGEITDGNLNKTVVFQSQVIIQFFLFVRSEITIKTVHFEHILHYYANKSPQFCYTGCLLNLQTYFVGCFECSLDKVKHILQYEHQSKVNIFPFVCLSVYRMCFKNKNSQLKIHLQYTEMNDRVYVKMMTTRC